MNINISSYVILSAQGSIDHEGTISKFSGDLLRFEAERETENATIGQAVHALFDLHLGKRLPMPYLTGEALKSLNAQPENYKVLSDKVAEFVRTSPQFDTAKGKGGGCGRVADLPVK